MRELLSGHLKARLTAGDCIGMAWLALGDNATTELVLHSAPDAVVLDLQHGLWERRTMEQAIGQCIGRAPVIIRIADDSGTAIGNALDAGADGILVPMIETAEQAASVVAAATYPPHGRRSGGGVRPLGYDFEAYLQKAGNISIGVMIETASGLRNAETIVNVPGIDYIFIGSGDLMLSCHDKSAAEREAECQRVLQLCQARNLPCGIFTGSVEQARAYREQGYQLVVIANDISVIRSGFAKAVTAFSEKISQ